MEQNNTQGENNKITKKSLLKRLREFFSEPNCTEDLKKYDLIQYTNLTIEELQNIIEVLKKKKAEHIMYYNAFSSPFDIDLTPTISMFYDLKICKIEEIINEKKKSKMLKPNQPTI